MDLGSNNSRIFYRGTTAGPISHLIVLWFTLFSFSFLPNPFSPSDHEEQFEQAAFFFYFFFFKCESL